MAQSVTRQWPALPGADPEQLRNWAAQITRLLQEGAIVDGLGPGDVVGPAGSVGDGNVVLFDGTTGEVLKDSGFPLSASGNRFGVIPVAGGATGTMDIGPAIDFHNSDGDTGDFAVRLETGGTTDRLQVVASSPSATRDVDVTATVAEVRAAATGNFGVTAALLETASAGVALTDAATVAVDWDAFINATVVITANRALGTPSNAQPGTWRTIRVSGNDATLRSLTFAGYRGGTATLTDISNAKEYLLTLFSVSSTVCILKSTQAFP